MRLQLTLLLWFCQLYFILCMYFFFFNDTATTEIYTLSLHDALPISSPRTCARWADRSAWWIRCASNRSEEHTSELQSLTNLVCRLLLEKKKEIIIIKHYFQREAVASERYKKLTTGSTQPQADIDIFD